MGDLAGATLAPAGGLAVGAMAIKDDVALEGLCWLGFWAFVLIGLYGLFRVAYTTGYWVFTE